MKNNLKDWKAISVNQLLELSDSEKNELLSYCWKDGRYRCDTIGITNVEVLPEKTGNGIEYYKVSWSDMDGDPSIFVDSLDTLIDNIGDGQWNYGLYIKK